jgi:hypothetical protein
MANLRSRGDVIDVVAQGHEEIKEELGTAVEHFQLHGAAALESAARANDESEVMSPELGVIVGSVGIGISGRCKNGAALNSGLWIADKMLEHVR